MSDPEPPRTPEPPLRPGDREREDPEREGRDREVGAPDVLGADEIAGAFALLAELTQNLAISDDPRTALVGALSSIGAQVQAEAGSLWLLDDSGEELVCQASFGPNDISGLRVPLSQGIVGRSVRENIAQQVLDVDKDGHFSGAIDEKTGFKTHSLLCAPISFDSAALGAIQLVNKKVGDFRFDHRDIYVLRVLATSASLAFANARMAASLVEADRVRRELELAAEIQRNLLPVRRGAEFPVHGVNLPAREVSGDFFDILPLAEGRIAFCLGDVSGKGMNAALLMAKTSALFRCLAKSILRPGQLMEQLDAEISETATRGMFVTMVCGVLEPSSGHVCLANAGHEPPLLHRPGDVFSSIPAEAPPLGIGLALGALPETELSLDGGCLYLCSDGLTEATEDGHQLGAEGLRRLVSRYAGESVDRRVDAIARDVSRLDRRDDLTLLAVGASGS